MIRVSSEDKARIEDCRQSLINHGYHTVAVETGGKAPRTRDWCNASPVVSVDEYQANTGLLAGSISVIDIDIEDPERVAAIVDHCLQHFGKPMVRSRDGSARIALIYRSSDPTRRKSVIQTHDGDIEILGNGQQVVVDGIHPMGTRYQLSDLVPVDELPVFTDTHLKSLRQKFESIVPTSVVITGFTEGSRNQSLYQFGIDNAGGKSYDNLYELLSKKNRTECTPPLNETEVAAIAGSVYHSFVNANRIAEPPGLSKTDKGKIKPTRDNFEKIMNHCGCLPVFNAISKDLGVERRTEGGQEFVHGECAYAEVIDQLARVGCPKSMADNYFAASCLGREINPVKDWVESKPWDKVDRIVDLYLSLGVDESIDSDLGIDLLTKWLVSGVRAAFGKKGVAAQGVLVLQGPQNTGKTTWLKGLLNDGPDVFLEGAVLQPDNKDSVLKVIGHWIVELGELDATFRKADLSKLKAFITSATDDLRRPYGRAVEKIQRRTIFCGSVNTDNFLADETGNRRYWILPVTGFLNINHGLDMQQVWAQAYSLYQDGYPIYLTADECNKMDVYNRQFERKGLLDAMLQKAYSWDVDRPEWSHWKSTGEILMDLGAKTEDGTKNTAKLGLALKAWEVEKKRTKRGMCYLMPPLEYSQLGLIHS
jgi:hypothetical protein